VKQELDHAPTIQATDDRGRGYVFLRRVLELAGIPASPATAGCDRGNWSPSMIGEGAFDVVAPGAVEALKRLRSAACQIVVVSNSNGRARESSAGPASSRTSISSSTRRRRASRSRTRASSRVALERSRADRRATIHCGDIYHIDVVGARAAGLRPRCCSTPRAFTRMPTARGGVAARVRRPAPGGEFD